MDIKKTWLFTRPIAHRGLHSADTPENSLGAFEKAVENGFPVEFDVRLTDDGEVVVFHDDKLSRLTQKDGYASNLTAQDLKDMRLFNDDGTPSEWKIPTFDEALEVIGGRVPILIETKSQRACGQLESVVIEKLRSYRGEFAVQSFSPYSLEYFKLNAFEIPRGQLSKKFEKQDLQGAIKRRVLRKLKMNKVSQPDFISYRSDDLPNKYVTKANLPVIAWTIRSNTELERVRPFCDNIIFENFLPRI